MLVAPGATSVSVDVFFADDTGAAVTGKVAADFPACKWSSGTNTADTTITLSDLAAITTAHPNDNTAGGVKEREGGVYRLDLPNNMFTAAGTKTLTFVEATNKRIIVLGGVFEVQYSQSDLRQIGGVTQSATDLKDLTDTGYDPATHKVQGVVLTDTVTTLTNLPTIPTDWLTAAGLATDAVNEIRNAITGGAYALNTDASGNAKISDGTGANQIDTVSGGIAHVVLCDTITAYTGNTPQTGDAFLRIGLAGAGLTDLGGMSTTMKAQVQTECDDALQAFHLVASGTVQDTGASTTVFKTSLTNVTNSIADCMVEVTIGSFVELKDILTYNSTNGTITVSEPFTSAPANGVAIRVWKSHIHTTQGVADVVWQNATRTLTALGFVLGAADIGTDAIDADSLATDAVNEIRNAVTGGAYALNTDASGNVKISDGTGANQLDTTSGAVAHVILCDTTTTNTDLVTAAAVWAAGTRTLTAGTNIILAKGIGVTGFNDLSSAAVNAEVVDALSTDTYTEPAQGAPGVAISIADKIAYLYTSWRNKKDNDGTTTNLYADNGTTVIAKQATSSLAGTVSKAEWITGA